MNLQEKICIQILGAQYVLLEVAALLYVEADRQVCYFVQRDGSRLTASRHLGYYRSGLVNLFQFVEASKSVLINPAHIVRYAQRTRTIYLEGGHQIVVSKTKQELINRMFRELHERWKPDD